MKVSSSAFRVFRLLMPLLLIVFLYLLYTQAQEPAHPNADLENLNFDFNVYYTGNVRGNLEPCG